MKILFINNLLGKDCIGRVPLGILYLSAALKHSGHEVELVSTNHFKHLLKKIDEYRPHLLMYSVRTISQRLYSNLNQRIRAHFPELFSVFGGPHPTFYPQLIHKETAIDAVCIGEGEEAIVDFVNRLEMGKEYHLTLNFWVRKDGQIFQNQPRHLINNVDKVLFPDRDILNGYARIRDFPVRNFITSRGCPYNCTYCFNHAYNRIYKGLGDRVRRRSVDNVIEEIEEEYKKAPFQMLQFEDDIFAVPGKWLEEFSEKYKKKICLPFTCNVRAELISQKEVSLLQSAGCKSIWIGIESGSEIVRKNLLKRNNTDSTTINCIKLFQDAGISVATENILGLPETTLNEDFQTFELNRTVHPGFANPSIYQPYPGTDLGQRAKDAGIFKGNFEDIKNFYSGTILNVKHHREIENLQYLFSVSVEFSFLARFLPWLVQLPLGFLYKGIQGLWRGYALSHRIFPVKLSPKQWFHVVVRSFVH